MTELEKVEKLREKTDVSFAEAKDALDKSGGDILDALILLESQGKATIPAGGGFFSGADVPSGNSSAFSASSRTSNNTVDSGETFTDLMKRFGAFCLKMFNKGLSNYLEATKGDQHLFSCPVLVLVLLLIFFFWVTVPLFILSLFFGFNYRFSGADLGKDAVNSVMDSAADVVADVKKTFVESTSKSTENSDQTNQ